MWSNQARPQAISTGAKGYALRGRGGGVITVLACLSALGNAAILGRVLPAWRLPRLSMGTGQGTPGGPLPRLSVIVPARNEAANLEAALRSILRQDYPDLELVLINDRSTDNTGPIMAEFAARHNAPGRNIRVVTIEELPPDWLGKNHALWVGARHASGSWLLFTDADIVFAPLCFRLAVAHAEATATDHLTLGPDVLADTFWLGAFVAFFTYAFMASQQPHRANDPGSGVGVGLGAFNLIRRTAYEIIGTHAALSLRPDDDVRLGMRVKGAGLRQCFLDGSDILRVNWYPSLRAAANGLEKNVFAGLDYSLARAIGGLGGFLLLTVLPYLMIWRARGSTRLLSLIAIGLHSISFSVANRHKGRAVVRYLLVLPFAGAFFCFVVARSVWLALTRRGIRWRDTYYSLAALRQQTGLEDIPGRE